MTQVCQACQRPPVTVVEQHNDSPLPYRLCQPCYERLLNRALRPLEDFNLVAIHGHDHELHDDFYDEDGTACAAEEPVVEEDSLAFPTLPSLHDNVARLVDYALVKWFYPAEVTAYLQNFTPQQLLRVLDEKLTLNPALLPQCLEVAAEALGAHAYQWVKYQLSDYDGADILVFAQALARCFPAPEAEAVLLPALAKLSEKALAENITCLRYLAGDGPLDWMETHCRTITTVSAGYGYASAALGMSWPRVQRWLEAGRPLSLIALDTLVNCSTTADTHNTTPWLREHPPHLLSPAPIEEMNQVLTQYLQQDSVPRTKNAIGFIQRNWAFILKLEETGNPTAMSTSTL